MKVISIILKTSFDANGGTTRLFSFWREISMLLVGHLTQWWTKVSATKTPVSRPNIIKLYNNGMDTVDIMDQKTAT